MAGAARDLGAARDDFGRDGPRRRAGGRFFPFATYGWTVVKSKVLGTGSGSSSGVPNATT